MKRLSIILILLVTACSKVPEAKETAKGAEPATDAAVSTQKKSIEEAADEAAKLVEAEAKEEIEAIEPSEPVKQPESAVTPKEK
jgi:hypothetical protein